MKIRKNIFSLFIGILMVMLSFNLVSAYTIDYSFASTQADYQSENLGGSLFQSFNSSQSEMAGFVGNIGLINYDSYLGLYDLEQDIYILPFILSNITWNISIKDHEENTISYLLNFPEPDTYYIKISPSYEGEDLHVYINDTSLNSTYQGYYLQSVEPMGLSFVITQFVGYTSEIVEMNVTIWKVGFYLVLFALSIGLLGSLVYLAFKFYNYAQKVSKIRNDMFSNKRGR